MMNESFTFILQANATIWSKYFALADRRLPADGANWNTVISQRWRQHCPSREGAGRLLSRAARNNHLYHQIHTTAEETWGSTAAAIAGPGSWAHHSSYPYSAEYGLLLSKLLPAQPHAHLVIRLQVSTAFLSNFHIASRGPIQLLP